MDTKETVRVTADDRERGSGAAVALAADCRVDLEFRRLATGDYEVDAVWLFERKTLCDLGRSIADGRLFRQAIRMAKSPGTPGVVIVEGDPADTGGSGVRPECVQGAIVCLSVFMGIPVLWTAGGEETARVMLDVAFQGRRAATGAVRRPGCRPKKDHARRLFVLQGLPGVGPRKAHALLEAFGSVEAVMCAGPSLLATVSGIGAEVGQDPPGRGPPRLRERSEPPLPERPARSSCLALTRYARRPIIPADERNNVRRRSSRKEMIVCV